MQLTKWAGKVPYLLLLKCSMLQQMKLVANKPRFENAKAIFEDRLAFCRRPTNYFIYVKVMSASGTRFGENWPL